MNATVRDVMTHDPTTIDPEAPLATAIAVMRERGLRHLPVQDEAGRLVGLIADRDLRNAVLAPVLAEHLSAIARRRLRAAGESLENLRVRDAMTWDVLIIAPDAPIARAAALMLEQRVGSLPVVEGGRLVGIVTERDVPKMLLTSVPAVRGIDPSFLW